MGPPGLLLPALAVAALLPRQGLAQRGAAPLPCLGNLEACLSLAGVEELGALHRYVDDIPRAPQAIVPNADHTSRLELGTFALLRQLGLAVLAGALEFVILCRSADPLCDNRGQHVQRIFGLRADLEAEMSSMCLNYAPDNGARSAAIRVGRNLKSDWDRFANGAAGAIDGFGVLDWMAELARSIGLRARMLAHVLGMHFWVRTLVVPGRGAPVFVLHDEYTSWGDMLRTLVANMARNGLRELTLAEVGLPAEAHQLPLLREFPGLRYVGVFLDRGGDGASAPDHGAAHAAYQRLGGQLQEFAPRAAVHFASSTAVASAIPLKALDLAFLDVGAGAGNVAQDLESWGARVKPGGVLAGRGFGPELPEAVRAVCSLRFGNDIHLGAGGGFWWFVEPEEEE